jgi:hypothetical protein
MHLEKRFLKNNLLFNKFRFIELLEKSNLTFFVLIVDLKMNDLFLKFLFENYYLISSNKLNINFRFSHKFLFWGRNFIYLFPKKDVTLSSFLLLYDKSVEKEVYLTGFCLYGVFINFLEIIERRIEFANAKIKFDLILTLIDILNNFLICFL